MLQSLPEAVKKRALLTYCIIYSNPHTERTRQISTHKPQSVRQSYQY
jgi:hypothetical protein